MGWIIMELPSLLAFMLCFLLGPNKAQPVTWIFFTLYVAHYTNRSVIYPWRTRTSGKQMPLVVALMAVCFNLINGFINGYYFSAFSRIIPRNEKPSFRLSCNSVCQTTNWIKSQGCFMSNLALFAKQISTLR